MIFLFTTLSNIFITCDVRLTGRYCSGLSLDPPLWIGVTYASLKRSGIFPSSRLFLSINFRGVTIESLVFIKNFAGIPSGPADEFIFKSPIAFIISSSNISMSVKSPSSVFLNVSLSTLGILLLILN
ncbi:unnamed protein product [Meganyctiphanes norvegica]|uniref:Uncharacterized protein n=1 Tax=Meganyctiphanes norvegica TaxID=48144 RepID=A0AAV2R2X3_MEGNR